MSPLRNTAATTALLLGAIGVLASACGSAGPTTRSTQAPTSTQSTAATTTSTSAPAGPAGGPVPAGFRPQSVTFVSPSTGWVLGTAPCAAQPCTSLVRTTDGGSTWRGIPAPVEALAAYGAPGQPGLVGIRFADERDGWAWGDKLWATHDGGAHWSSTTPQPAGAIAALEPTGSTVYALTSSGDATATLYRSPAGGGPWSVVETLTDAGSDPHLVAHGPHLLVLTSGPTSTLYRSADGGATWNHTASPCPAGGLSSGAAADADGGYVALSCTSNGGMGSTTKRVFVSTDGGVTFRPTGGEAPRGGDNADLAVASAGNLVMASQSAASWLYASFDGGTSWQTVLQSNTGGQPWRDLGFTTPTQGVVVEGMAAMPDQQSLLWMTTDGGRHWSKVGF